MKIVIAILSALCLVACSKAPNPPSPSSPASGSKSHIPVGDKPVGGGTGANSGTRYN
jgi:hypothetical protein